MIVTNAFANDEFYGKSTHGQFPKGLIFFFDCSVESLYVQLFMYTRTPSETETTKPNLYLQV